MNISNLPKATEIYNQVRQYQGVLSHLGEKSQALIVKVELQKPKSGNGVNNESITLHEFSQADPVYQNVINHLIEEYDKKIKELKQEFEGL